MRTIIISLLFLFPCFLFTQFKSSLDLVGSADISYRDINYKQSESYFQNNKTGFDGDVASVRFRFGFNYNYRLSERLVLKTGLRLSNIGYKSYYSGRINFGEYTPGMDGFTVPFDVKKRAGFSTSYNHFFIEVPLIARYEFKNSFGKFQPYLEAGFSGMYYLKSLDNEEKNGSKSFVERKYEHVKPFQLSSMLGVGVNYNLSERTQLFFQPTFRYNLNPMYNSAVKENAFSVGFEMGLRIRLN